MFILTINIPYTGNKKMKNAKSDNKQKNNKSNLTISVNNDVLIQIKNDADLHGLSINAKVNSILAKYVSFYRIAEDMESSVIPAKIWTLMVDLMDEAKLLDILNNEGIGTFYSIFLNNSIPLTTENFIKYCCQEIFLWSGMYSSIRQFESSRDITLVFEHKFGIKWSRVMASAFSNIIKILLNHSTETQILPNTVKIIIHKK
jgi:hypothetical protein